MCCRITYCASGVLSFSRSTLCGTCHTKINDVVKQTAVRIRRKVGYLFTFGPFAFSSPPLLFYTTKKLPPILLARTSPNVVAVRLGRRFVTQAGKQIRTHIPPENSRVSAISLSHSLTNRVLLIRRMSDRQVRYCFFPFFFSSPF